MSNDYSNQSPEVQSLHAAFDSTGFDYTNRAETLGLFKQQVGVPVFDATTGTHTVYHKGKTVPFADVLKDFSVANKDTLLTKKSTVQDRASLATVTEKVAFVEQFGGDAYEALPTNYAAPKAVIEFYEDFKELPPSKKAALIDLHGSDYPGTLSKRPDPNAVPGGNIRFDLLEKQKKIRPGR